MEPRRKRCPVVVLAATLLVVVTACVPDGGGRRCLAEEGSSGFGASPSPLRPVRPEKARGDLAEVIDDFVQKIPAGAVGPRSVYDIPDRREIDRFRRGLACVQQDFLDVAGAVLKTLNYEVVKFEDEETDREVIMVREKERRIHHWGTFIVDPGSSSNLTVEVSQPCPDDLCERGDLFTHLVGVEAFRKVRARYLFITGAAPDANGQFNPDPTRRGACRRRRICADAAHNRRTMFHQVHVRVATRLVYQPHAFFFRDHPDLKTQDIDVVVSNGKARFRDDSLSTAVFNALKKTDEFGVCRFEGEASKCNTSRLNATGNVQSIRTNARRGSFISVEAEMRTIGKGNRLELLAGTVACTMAPAPDC
ncbi:MAG: hypothetical protein ACRDJF_03290 [Actinomycetota bacterium]